jgi:RNA recognition motif-containing protein
VFDEFGPIEFITLHKEPDGLKAYAFIQYKRGEDAKKALRAAGDVMVKVPARDGAGSRVSHIVRMC